MHFLIPIIVLLGSILIRVYLKRKEQNPLDKLASWPYGKTTQLLNPLEITFYQALRDYLSPSLLVLPKMRMQNLVYVPPNTRLSARLKAKMTDKYFDFVICQATDFRPLCVVEFDDEVDKEKKPKEIEDLEKILNSVSLHLFRYTPQYEYNKSDFQPINALYASGEF